MENYTEIIGIVEKVKLNLTSVENLILTETDNTTNINSFLVNCNYKQIYIPKKKSSNKRIISIPPKLIQHLLGVHFLPLFNDLYNLLKPNNVYGYVNNIKRETNSCNIKFNAEKHISNDWVLNFDLLNFFSSIKKEKIINLYSSAPFSLSADEAITLANLTTHDGELPIGACTSPILSNLVFIKLDKELNELSVKNNLVYTRYSDDLTFSSKSKPSHIIINSIVSAIARHGYEINYKKYNLKSKNERQEVTGLVVNQKLNVKREYYKLLEAVLYNLKKDYEINSEKYIQTYSHQYHKYLKNRTHTKQKKYGYFNYQLNKYYLDVKFVPSLFYSAQYRDHFIQESLKGKIKFIQFVNGKNDSKVLKLWNLYNLIYPPQQIENYKENENSELQYVKNANSKFEDINVSIQSKIAYITNATAKSVVYYAYIYLKYNKIEEPEILKLISECSKNDKLNFEKLKNKFIYQAANFIFLYDYLKTNNRFQKFIESNIHSGEIEEMSDFWVNKGNVTLPNYFRQIFHEKKDCENIISDYKVNERHHINSNIFANDMDNQMKGLYIVTKDFLERLGMRCCYVCQVSDREEILNLLKID
jgi:hypothetical protein